MMALSILDEFLLAEFQGQVLNGTWGKGEVMSPHPLSPYRFSGAPFTDVLSKQRVSSGGHSLE